MPLLVLVFLQLAKLDSDAFLVIGLVQQVAKLLDVLQEHVIAKIIVSKYIHQSIIFSKEVEQNIYQLV